MQNNNYKTFSLEELHDIAARLFPDKKVERHSYELRIGNKGSIVVRAPGLYYDHGDAAGGGIVNLVMKTLSCGPKAALEWCGNSPTSAKQYTPLRPKSSDTKGKIARALKHWVGAENIKGTLGERYFREHRGLEVDLPNSLKFIPKMSHPKGIYYPAVIAGVFSVDRRFIGIHAIYLDPDTGNKIDNKAKISFGPVAGGAIRLSKLQNKLIICEGIEDGLSLLQSDPNACVWACLGTSGINNVEIPTSAREVVIAADNDDDNAGIKAAQMKKRKLLALGHNVIITMPPQGYKDMNDLLRGKPNA